MDEMDLLALRAIRAPVDEALTGLSRHFNKLYARDLEHELGATLFERTNGGTRPTIEGQEFLDAARRIVEETKAITTRLKPRSRGESGRLTIGVHAFLAAGNRRATFVRHCGSLRCRLFAGRGTAPSSQSV
jgi:hypothetical protein